MTTTDKHQKHPKIVKARLGKFARQEWAIYGTSCSNIEALAEDLIAALSADYAIALIDADHKEKAPDFTIAYEEKRIQYRNQSSFNE